MLTNWLVPLLLAVLVVGLPTELLPSGARPYLYAPLACALAVAFTWRLLRIRLVVDSVTGALTVANLFRTYHIQATEVTRIDSGTYSVGGRYGKSEKRAYADLSCASTPGGNRRVRIMASISNADGGELITFLRGYDADRKMPGTL